jgi:hypothetical protein
MKPKIKSYYKPTPVKMRKLGDAMLGASTFAATTWQFYMTEPGKWPTIMLTIGVVGKFITNFFTDDETNKNTPPSRDCDPEPGA